MQLAAISVLLQNAVPVHIAVASPHTSTIRDELDSVAVDLPLNVPGQVHIGMYKQVSDDLYIRDLPWVNVYFSLQHLSLDGTTGSLVKWQFRGYECSSDKDRDDHVCSEFTTAKLESDRGQGHAPRSRIPHIIARQSPLTAEERRLQFKDPEAVDPPSFSNKRAYYDCAYSNGGSRWCCAQSNQGSGGPYCWSMSKCTEEWSGWNQQNIICCTESAGDCELTYKPPMPTATPAPTTTTAPATTSPPATEDPFGDIPILVDTTPPSTSAAPTAAPTTSAPVTASPVTSPPATEDPFNDIPILADTPATSAPTTATPVTSAPVTSAPVTSAPVTSAPVTSAPVTSAPVTSAPVTNAPVTSAPVTSAPVTSAPVTSAPVTSAPVTSAPVTNAPVTMLQ
ncbi:hypothetical protein PC110_g9763 [Phytophthora cactorum]|uniref:Uncharacterized protein n=1 Tax=Phytophthora cactorum TaxID=29920 RepID=A0A329SBA5_9STRA|nr:hypothetical protein PC110_g9763 [Phytophthora cactorum]